MQKSVIIYGYNHLIVKAKGGVKMRIDRVKFAAALARADLTVNELANLSGISRVTVSSIKSGKSCTRNTANKLVAVLGSDIIENTAATVGNDK